MCGSAMITPRPAARLPCSRSSPVACMPDQDPRPPGSPAAGTPPASIARRSAWSAGTARAAACRTASGPSTRRRLPSSTWTRGPCRRQARSAPAGRPARAQDSGRPADQLPAQRVRRVAEPVAQSLLMACPVPVPRPVGRWPDRAGLIACWPDPCWPARLPRRGPGPGWPAQPAGRGEPGPTALADHQHPLAERDRAQHGQRPQADRQHVRHAEPGQADRHQDDEQPLGALGHPHVGPDAQALGPGPGVGHHRARDQAVQRHAGQHRLMAARASQMARPAKTAASPIRSRVESRNAPQGRRCLSPGPAGRPACRTWRSPSTPGCRRTGGRWGTARAPRRPRRPSRSR